MPPYQNQNGQPEPPQPPLSPAQGPDQSGLPQPLPYQQPQEYPQPAVPMQPPSQPAYPQPDNLPQQQVQPLVPQQLPSQPGVYAPQSAGQEQNPYSFFLEDSHPASKSSLLGGSSSMAMRLLVAFGGLTALIITGGVMYSLLFSAPDNTDRLTSLATQQHELLRVSKLGAANVDAEKLENFAYTASLTLGSSQKELLAYLSSAGVKTNEDTLALDTDPKVDEALKAAEAANTYDTTYTAIVHDGLMNYEAKLSQARQAAVTDEEKAVLEKQHATALLLIKQLGVPTS